MDHDVTVLLDTNILISATEGDSHCLDVLEQQDRIGISVICEMELMIGMRDQHEEALLTSILLGIDIIPLTHEIAYAAIQSLSGRRQKNVRSPHFADTVIAHTALLLNVPLITRNAKDFTIFKDLKIIVPQT